MGACCCAQRSKYDFDFTATGELQMGTGPQEEERQHSRALNQLPTYENMVAAYECIISSAPPAPNQVLRTTNALRVSQIPSSMAAGEQSENTGIQLTSDPMGVVDRLLHHRKERMFFMIINLLRLRPGIFMEQVSAFKARCDLRQTSVRGLLVFAPEDVDAAIEMLANTQQTHALELNADLCELCREPKIVGVSPANSAGKTFTVENNKASRFDVTKGATNGDKA